MRDCIVAVERALAATPDAVLAREVERLSDLYTTGRGRLADEQQDARHLAAKREYFLASDAPKVALALSECTGRHPAFARLATLPRLRILDLGAGTGATSVGLLAFLAAARAGSATPLEVAIDAVEGARPAAAALPDAIHAAARATGFRVELEVVEGDLRRARTGGHPPYDLILCQTALNELLVGEEHAASTVALVGRWARASPLLVIEPALHATTRALMALRDALVAEGAAHVVAPCLHQRPCPMRARPGDWCHEARSIERTPRVEAIDRIVGRRDARALYSFVATVPTEAAATSSDAGDGRTVRLVTDPLGSRGKTERLACRDDGQLRLLRLLDREANESNRAFLEAGRGDIVAFSEVPPADRIRPTVMVARATRAASEGSG